jgi:hypothetical protein
MAFHGKQGAERKKIPFSRISSVPENDVTLRFGLRQRQKKSRFIGVL